MNSPSANPSNEHNFQQNDSSFSFTLLNHISTPNSFIRLVNALQSISVLILKVWLILSMFYTSLSLSNWIMAKPDMIMSDGKSMSRDLVVQITTLNPVQPNFRVTSYAIPAAFGIALGMELVAPIMHISGQDTCQKINPVFPKLILEDVECFINARQANANQYIIKNTTKMNDQVSVKAMNLLVVLC